MAADTNAGEPAHDGGEQTDEQPDGERFVVAESTIERGVIVALCDADVERIEFEIEQKDGERANESVEEWIEHAVHMQFAHHDHRHDRQATPTVEVPDEIARRARLRLESARQRGKEIEDEQLMLDEYISEYLEVRPDWEINDPETAAAILDWDGES